MGKADIKTRFLVILFVSKYVLKYLPFPVLHQIAPISKSQAFGACLAVWAQFRKLRILGKRIGRIAAMTMFGRRPRRWKYQQLPDYFIVQKRFPLNSKPQSLAHKLLIIVIQINCEIKTGVIMKLQLNYRAQMCLFELDNFHRPDVSQLLDVLLTVVKII